MLDDGDTCSHTLAGRWKILQEHLPRGTKRSYLLCRIKSRIPRISLTMDGVSRRYNQLLIRKMRIYALFLVLGSSAFVAGKRPTAFRKKVGGVKEIPMLPSTPALKDTSVLATRGGACGDSDPALFTKISVNAVVEAAAMLGILAGSKALAEKFEGLSPSIFGLPLFQWTGLLLIIFASSFVGSIVEGGLSAASNQVLDPNVVPGDPNWYAKLKKPSWNPPGWLFPIMWLIVSKPTQAVAVSKILKLEGDLPLSVLAVYTGHLALGDAWNKVFFGLECVGRGAAVISAFFGMLLTSAYVFYQEDPTAGLFLLPTCGWVLVATALNWSIYFQNKK